MKTKLTGLALLATLLAPPSASAWISSDGDKLYSPRTLFYGSCDYHGYKLKLKCDTLRYHSGKHLCDLVETRNKSKKLVKFPKDLAYPLVVAQIYPFQRVLYCKDPPKPQLVCRNPEPQNWRYQRN